MDEFKQALRSYLKMISYLKNSCLLNNICVRNNETEDAYDLLYLPVCRLSSIYEKVRNDISLLDDLKMLSAIKNDSNGIWYAIDCRSDIRRMIPNDIITVDPESKNKVLSFCRVPLNTSINIDKIHLIAGEIELEIEDFSSKNTI